MSAEHSFMMNIASLNVRMNCEYPYAKHLCEDFIVESGEPDVTVAVTATEIENEKKQYAPESFSDGYCEGICLYRAIAEKLPSFDGFVFHGAAVTVNGRGYIFAAPSGTGKTTHISLLMKNYPDEVKILNGDKPIIRYIDGEWRICSTPWAGKEGWKINSTAPLDGIVLVARAEVSSIEKISPEQYFDDVIRQVYLPVDPEAMMLTLSLVDEVANGTTFYRLECNISDDAAKTTFNALA